MYFLLFDSLLRCKYNFWMTLILSSVYLKLLFKRENEVVFFVILTIFLFHKVKIAKFTIMHRNTNLHFCGHDH